MADLDKVIKGLESHRERTVCVNEEGEVCPYFSYEDCYRRLTDDALELLKEQMPRVLTLEEATGEDECWLECDNGHCGYADCIMMFDGSVYLWRCFASEPKVMDCATYGRQWRCWTSKPKDEQRETTPWDEPPKEGGRE